MSYSINFRAASKADAKATVSAELDKVVAQQPVHAVDRAGAEAAAGAQIDLLNDDDSMDVSVSMSGSVGGTWGADNTVTDLTQANISVYASLSARDA